MQNKKKIYWSNLIIYIIYSHEIFVIRSWGLLKLLQARSQTNFNLNIYLNMASHLL